MKRVRVSAAILQIDYIVCPEPIADKLVFKHGITARDARQVLLNGPRFRFAEQALQPGSDVYAAFGQTFRGRHLSVFFLSEPDTATAIILSARDMTIKERRAYARKEEKINQQAKRCGVRVETLVNLWLQERLSEEAERAV